MVYNDVFYVIGMVFVVSMFVVLLICLLLVGIGVCVDVGVY